MSAFGTFETKITDAGFLERAAMEMGYEVTRMRDDSRIAIRSKPGASYLHAEAVKQADKTYRIQGDTDYVTQSWVGKLTQRYAEVRTITQAARKGYVFAGREMVGNAVKLRFLQR